MTSPKAPLADRMRPSRLDDMVGNPRARAELRQWAGRWEGETPPARRAAVLSGPPGVGKTTAALAVAADHGWSVVEMNASDARNESAIEQVAGRASITHTLLGAGRDAKALILLDEADCLTGRLTETPRPAPEPVPLREFLRGRYGTVEALNTAWGVGTVGKTKAFAGWDDLPRSPGNSAWARLPIARKDIEEWRAAGRAHDVSDRGGLAAIVRLVRDTRQPLVLTVNDDRTLTRYSTVFRNGVERIRFYPIRDAEIASRLTSIATSERIRTAPGAIDAIVRRVRGDLRAGLNDLDAIAPLGSETAQLSVLSVRDTNSDLAQLTEEVLTASRYFRSSEVMDRIDAPPDDLLPWVEENIAHFAPDRNRRDDAFTALAAAEQMLGRARRYRVWGLWTYASEVLTGGVSVSIRGAPVAVTRGASFPQFLGEMGRSRGVRSTRESLVAKLGRRFHVSHEKTRESVLPFLDRLVAAARRRATGGSPSPLVRSVVRELELSDEEVGYLLGVPPDSPEVRKVRETTPEPSAVAAEGADAASETSPRRDTDAGRRPRQRQLSDFSTR